MINPALALAFVSAIAISYPLFRGAVADLKTRKFPKEYWDGIPVKVAVVATLGMYLYLAYSGSLFWALYSLVVSVVLTVVFYVLGINYGSGGDYRALIYISLLAPVWAIQTVILSVVFGMIQVGYGSISKKSVPWALGIYCAFVFATIYDATWITLQYATPSWI